MNAGSTQHPVGTRIRIAKVADLDDQFMVGMTGELTHAFPGLMTAPASQYIAGVLVDSSSAAGKLAPGPLGDCKVNLMSGDEFEVI